MNKLKAATVLTVIHDVCSDKNWKSVGTL